MTANADPGAAVPDPSEGRRPRILFVCMPSSPHASRWIASIADAGWDLHVFGVNAQEANPLLQGVTLHWPQPPAPAMVQMLEALPVPPAVPRAAHNIAFRLTRFVNLLRENPRLALKVLGYKLGLMPPPPPASPESLPPPEPPPPAPASLSMTAQPAPAGGALVVSHFTPHEGLVGSDPTARVPLGDTGRDCPVLHSPKVLAELIRELKPDLVHSMEFQHAAYLTLAARDVLGAENFPPWLATNWGSDIYHFGREPAHAAEIRRVLEAADLYSCECRRDIALAREFGFTGHVLPVLPNSGGLDLDGLERLRNSDPPSRRRRVMVKGYDHFAGRGMIALDVLERFAPELRGYEIVLFSVGPRVRKRGGELRSQGLLDIRIIDWAPHEEILWSFAKSRIYLGISISDAISTSVLEAMAMGAFPVQTNTSCCTEWFEDGVSGFAVPHDNFETICAAFGRALQEDELVDRAAVLNREVVENRLDVKVVRPQVRAFYEEAFTAVSGKTRGGKEERAA